MDDTELTAAARPPDAAPALAPKRIKAAVVALLALALGCVALAFWAGQRQTAIQGPWGLAVLPGGQIWLSVDDQLWRLDASGQRQQVVRLTETGLPGMAGVLMPHPQGYLAAWSRHQPVLHLLDPVSARPVARLAPQWPADLARHGDEAIHYAFAPDGRVAIAAGGGDAVALFDAQGRFLARSPAGAFKFTNGLWWADDGWWCTDTNRPALVLLDGARLTETRRVALTGQQGVWRFLGQAAASRGAARDGQAPIGIVERLSNGMKWGHMVDVWPDGQQRAYPLPDGADALELRGMAWLGDTLLALDGQGFAIHRYSADRQLLADWGDATVRADLARRYAQVQIWRYLYYGGLVGAVALLLAGLALAAREQRLRARAQLAGYAPDVAAQADLRAPSLWDRRLVGPLLRAGWPLLVTVVLVLLGIKGLSYVRGVMKGIDPSAFLWAFTLMMAVMMVLLTLAYRPLLRALQSDPALEPVANGRARQMLARPRFFWPLCQPGEQPRETLTLVANRWLVLTNRRLLVFGANAFDARLRLSVPRGAIVSAQTLPLRDAPRWYLRWQGWITPGVEYLQIALADGRVIAGIASCAPVARRVAALLGQPRAGLPQAIDLLPPPPAPTDLRGTRWQVLASALLPGLGQWMQGRFQIGLLFFVIWLVLMGQLAFFLWVVWTHSAEVRMATLWIVVVTAFIPSLVAAWDAWNLRGRAPQLT